MLLSHMGYILQEFVSLNGKAYFEEWFIALTTIEKVIITKALYKLEDENFSNVSSIANSLWEAKINTGPGYRIYFTKLHDNIIFLLTGGIKRSQRKDIKLAKQLVKEFKQKHIH